MSESAKRKMLSLTFNNLGCCYKKKGNPNVALTYLEQSLDLELQDSTTDELNLAASHLNLTSVLTKLGKHQEAIGHAKSAIIILRRLIDRKDPRDEGQNLFQTEAIAYYNLGASYEHIGGLEAAIKSYEIAASIVHVRFPPGHPLGKTIGESLEKV